MKKSELFDIAWHLWNNVDQAGHDMTIKEIMQNSSKDGLIKFIDAMLGSEGNSEYWNPDKEVLKRAKKLFE